MSKVHDSTHRMRHAKIRPLDVYRYRLVVPWRLNELGNSRQNIPGITCPGEKKYPNDRFRRKNGPERA